MTFSNQHLEVTLVQAARAVLGEFSLAQAVWTAGGVASALVTDQGHIYTGICVDLACRIGFCAEHAAIAAMLQARETQVEAIVAVGANGIMPPCGRCRELMMQVNAQNWQTKVFVGQGRFAALKDLLPEHWLPAS